MVPEPYEYTVVIKNNIPQQFSGTTMSDLFGLTPLFIKDDNGLKIQWQLFYNILEGKSGNKLFEFRTATNFIIAGNVEHAGFISAVYDHLITAINGFNWHFERNNSFLTMGKIYTPTPALKEMSSIIELAYYSEKKSV
jgi:hypothetical protein